jgi:hypothetical protein
MPDPENRARLTIKSTSAHLESRLLSVGTGLPVGFFPSGFGFCSGCPPFAMFHLLSSCILGDSPQYVDDTLSINIL